jgi:hypothetical protein
MPLALQSVGVGTDPSPMCFCADITTYRPRGDLRETMSGISKQICSVLINTCLRKKKNVFEPTHVCQNLNVLKYRR